MSMKVLIIEDETWAADSLRSFLSILLPEADVPAPIPTVREACQYLATSQPDLIFMDIHLGDGESFSIFEQVTIKAPVIFTTAYDQYALQAFKNQGIDYLLKPFDQSDILRALHKFQGLIKPIPTQQYPRKRFLVRSGIRMKTIPVKEVAFFMAEDKWLYLYTYNGDRFLLDMTLSAVGKGLPATEFYQVNRKFIVHIQSIAEIIKTNHNRLKVLLNPPPPPDITVIVSEERSPNFQAWLDQ
ncbi:two component transcriptional regulator, LytTR family [bacterium A37T11]|nr:two component transcriptional regulator, LytTR family [bacterium A37T11]